MTTSAFEAIGAIAERLADATRALAVYYHGDRARGDARDDDPWELLVVLPADVEPGRWTPVTLWPLVADAPMSIEVRAVTAATFAAVRDDPNAVSADAARDGLRLFMRHPKLGLEPTKEEIEAEAVGIAVERRGSLMRDAAPFPVVYDGKHHVFRSSRRPVSYVERMAAAGRTVDQMLAADPTLVRAEVEAYLADDGDVTMVAARRVAREIAASWLRRRR